MSMAAMNLDERNDALFSQSLGKFDFIIKLSREVGVVLGLMGPCCRVFSLAVWLSFWPLPMPLSLLSHLQVPLSLIPSLATVTPTEGPWIVSFMSELHSTSDTVHPGSLHKRWHCVVSDYTKGTERVSSFFCGLSHGSLLMKPTTPVASRDSFPNSSDV